MKPNNSERRRLVNKRHIMWNEMTHNLYRHRSTQERLLYENNDELTHDEYTQRIIDDQKIYDTENTEFESNMDEYYIIKNY